MSTLLVDASVAVAWCFEAESTAVTDRALAIAIRGDSVAPALWPLEIGNALLTAHRGGRLNQSELTESIQFIEGLPIELIEQSKHQQFHSVLTLAYANRLSCYDASYLDLALRHKLPIATLDAALTKAAKKMGVLIFG